MRRTSFLCPGRKKKRREKEDTCDSLVRIPKKEGSLRRRGREDIPLALGPRQTIPTAPTGKLMIELERSLFHDRLFLACFGIDNSLWLEWMMVNVNKSSRRPARVAKMWQLVHCDNNVTVLTLFMPGRLFIHLGTVQKAQSVLKVFE